MSNSILSTKLYIPPVPPELVARPHLIERLNEGLHRKLTLISAPAGFGKTTLVSEWLQLSDLPTTWLSLDAGDNDPTRFLAHFTAALQKIEPDIGRTGQAMLKSPQPPSIESLITGLINEIATTSTRFVIALDDYHVIEAEPIHDALIFLLDHLSSQMHLVIASRADPPLPLSRWRGRGQLTELREADLRFTTDEAATFLNELMGLNLSSAQISALEHRTEGWITGLHLAALSVQGHDDIAGFINGFTGSHRYILDYLTDEVLSRQPEEVQRFLFRTSILDRLSGPLCDAVAGRGAREQGSEGETCPSASLPSHSLAFTSSQQILEYLEAANLFLIALDDERRWYRYHHLFADLLRHRLRQNFPDHAPILHRRASEWYEQNGLLAEAVGHALTAADLERAADLIEQTAWGILIRGEMVMLLSWLGRLPDELAYSRPRLRIFRAWALALTGQLDAVESHLQNVDTQDLQGEVAAVRAQVAFLRQDVPRAITLARQSLEQLPLSNSFMRSIMALSLGTAHFWTMGDPAAACRTLTEAITLSRATGDSQLTLIATSTLGYAQQMQGKLHLAAESYRRALQPATSSCSQGEGQGGGRERPAPFAGLTHIGLAGLLYERNDLDGAKCYAQKGIELGERSHSLDVLQGGYSYFTLAQVCQATGQVDDALEMIRKAEQFAQRHNQTYVLALVAAHRAQLWVAQGNVTAAARWAQERGLSANDELSYLREFEHITLARVLTAKGQAEEALRLLDRLLEAAQAMERMGSMIKILTLKALTFQTQNDLDQALSALDQALFLAEPEGYVRIFVDEGQPMAMLLRRALSQSIAPRYVSRLLAVLNETGSPISPLTQPLVEPLSERELEVLRLVVAGLSNPEIAQELVIAVSTVKSHLNHIYGKLGVKNRIQAIDRARTLGLL